MTDSTLKVLEATTGGTDLGAIEAMQGATPVKIGKQHLVDVAGAATGVIGNPIAVSDGGGSITVDGTVAVTGAQTDALTNTQLRASAVPVSGTVTATDGGGSLTVDDGGASLTVDGSVSITGTAAVSGTVTANQGTAGAQAWPVSDGGSSLTVDGTVSVGNFPANQGVNLASGPGSAVAAPLFAERAPNDLGVSAVGAAAAALTVTLPAVAGQFHYIDTIEITLYATTAGTGGATPSTVTSTNLPGNTAWTFPSGRAIGTNYNYVLSANSPIRSGAAGTATTIVCPATTGALWRVNVFYRTRP